MHYSIVYYTAGFVRGFLRDRIPMAAHFGAYYSIELSLTALLVTLAATWRCVFHIAQSFTSHAWRPA